MSAPPESRGPRPWRRALWIILAAAAAIRIVGIFGQGFPYCFYPDETNAIQRALRFGAEHTANPGWFNKPALAYYLWFAAYGCFYVVGRLFGTFGSPEQFGIWAFDRVAPFLIIGRLVSTIFGVATVWLTYLLGKSLKDRVLGLVAALALTLTYAHVVTGQWVKEDVPCGFFHTAATLLLVSAIRKARVKDTIWAGILGGLGMATKYYSVALFLPAAFAHLLPVPSVGGRMRRRIALAALFVVAFGAGFFIGSPYNFLVPDFWQQHVKPAIWRIEKLISTGGVFGAISLAQAPRTQFVDTGGLSFLDASWALVESLYMPEGLGLVFFVLAALGGVIALVRRRRLDVFMLVAVVGQALFIALTNRQPSEQRHLVVLYPLLAVWVAESVLLMAGMVRKRLGRFSPAGLGCALLLFFSAVPTSGPSVARMLADRSLEPIRGDTRLAAIQWLEANLPNGSVIMNDHEVLPLRINEERAQWAIDGLRKKSGREAWTYLRRWQYRKDAASDRFRPTYDVLVVESWGAETPDALEKHRRTYDRTWPDDVTSRPSSVPPVARYAEAPPDVRRMLETRPARETVLARMWPASAWLVSGHPIQFLVSSEVTYDNYVKPKKRKDFPNRAAFYDDLKAHYDCIQWSAGQGGRTGPTIRIYDLRTRVQRAPVIREMTSGES